jgi:hypothetical protein
VLDAQAPRDLCGFSRDFVMKNRIVARPIDAIRHGEHSALTTFFVHRLSDTSVTTFAMSLASEGFGCVKAINAKQLIRRDEDGVCQNIHDVFEKL